MTPQPLTWTHDGTQWTARGAVRVGIPASDFPEGTKAIVKSKPCSRLVVVGKSWRRDTGELVAVLEAKDFRAGDSLQISPAVLVEKPADVQRDPPEHGGDDE